MTTTRYRSQLYDAYRQQVAAESYLEDPSSLVLEDIVKRRLVDYSNNATTAWTD